MANRRQIYVSKNVWKGLKRLSDRYDKPAREVADVVFDNSDLKLLDDLLGYKKKKKKRGEESL